MKIYIIKNLMLLFIALQLYSSNAQSIDYNTKRGYAVNGYDTVSYFYDAPQLGNKKFTTVYDGIMYKFSSQEHLDMFTNDPHMYIPQYGGYCAYAVAVAGEKISINPDTYEIRDGKLYLFYNSWGNNTLESWTLESPDVLKPMADINWEKIKNKQ